MECVWDSTLLDLGDQISAKFLRAIQYGNNEEYLEAITRAALDARYTHFIFAHCEDIFAHICATLPRYGTAPSALATIARIIHLAPYLYPYAERIVSGIRSDVTRLDESEGMIYLLGLYRSLDANRRVFIQYVDTAQIAKLLRHPRRAIVYLAIRILQICLSGADAWFEQMVMQHLGSDRPDNIIEGEWDDKVIDYRFLTLWEEKRVERLQQLIFNVKKEQRKLNKQCRSLPELCFDPSTTMLGRILLPRNASSTSANANTPNNFVATRTSLRNLNTLAIALRSTEPVLLQGLSGSGKTHLIRYAAQKLDRLENMLTLHLNEQSDAKMLLGVYSTGDKPGSFSWYPGVLTTAVSEGRWVLIEDLDRAPNEIISTLLPLMERRELLIPGRKQTIPAAPGFRLIATVRSVVNHLGEENMSLHMVGARHWKHVNVETASADELAEIAKYQSPVLADLLPRFMNVYNRLQISTRRPILVGRSRTGVMRPVTIRDMLKWCSRVAREKSGEEAFTTCDMDNIFLEATDCFVGALPDDTIKHELMAEIAEELHIDPQRKNFLSTERIPRCVVDEVRAYLGRYTITRKSFLKKPRTASYSINPFTSRMLERVAGAVINNEPLLLVGETGVGKTTAIQHLANQLGKNLVAFNLSQQSEAGDLIGGLKPISVRNIIVPLKDEFDELFEKSFSTSKNQKFLDLMGKQIAKNNWQAVCKLWRQALHMVEQQREKTAVQGIDAPFKKRKVESRTGIDFAGWEAFALKVADAEKRAAASSDAFAFKFVEGKLVKAVRQGDWVLLDEINLAAPDTLEVLLDLLDPTERSILLTDTNSIERVTAHPDFRMFASMNPATDVGKKDLPPGIRSRFTELYVESPEKDFKSLQSIVSSYINRESTTDKAAVLDVSTLYSEIVSLDTQNQLVDGAGHKPNFSLRTLTRTLTYARHITPLCNLRRALYEGFQMSFLTLLNDKSAKLIRPLLVKYLFHDRANIRDELQKPLRQPSDGHEYIQGFPGSKHWVRRGNGTIEAQPHYILTPFILRNIENLIRATSTRQSPVLLQGPTSSGKTSMIEYLAKRTGNIFVRINNHEHTDLQEYLGTYISGSDGRLHFQEGVLVKGLREGHWVVLDELNLAPSDVLEALNRLLDDNRELLIPETQEIVRPHENFMLFATQNPAGLYGGRKFMSRAFRNRFLELHFEDIPTNELQEILHRRTQLPESRCRRIVSVYHELSSLRQENRLFETQGFATLRDLFRWASRPNDTLQQLAENGFMLLAERVRKPEERLILKAIIEKCVSSNGPRVHINEELYSEASEDIIQYKQNATSQGVVWTKSMRRLFILVSRAIRNNEPVLLVGDTGCGKTTVCQMISEALRIPLLTINAHQNTETGDLIGSQRPIRNLTAVEVELRERLINSPVLQIQTDEATTISTNDLLITYDRALNILDKAQRQGYVATTWHQHIESLRVQFKALFQWRDGNLVQAMKEGSLFLLDEIALAEDSVLERLNSVLESERSVLLAEKGGEDVFVKAAPNFQFLATMNPGGDYGKRELSPALRNRFTEIWVPSSETLEDVLQIVAAKLVHDARNFAPAMILFAQWFNQTFRTTSSSAISIRSALAWVSFINAFASHDIPTAIVHGAAMVYIDALGANPSGLVNLTSNNLTEDRDKCFRRLSKFLGIDASSISSANSEVRLAGSMLYAGPFAVPTRNGGNSRNLDFSFAPPTTAINTLRIIRALQLTKPILLEGSPGVGKTALITAIATAVGIPLTRINLSEQTDVLDLFGTDAPVDGAQAGSFAWRDGPYLRAMKNGEWVLLDEMNLASQSVLESLNACLDHRGEAFIPELGQTFTRHPEFRLFAAQNPHHQGGGRKGLPASFVNRFTVVYADALKSEDLLTICKQRYPDVTSSNIERAVGFVSLLEESAVRHGHLGQNGGPWEFNLRDVSRWLDLATSKETLVRSASVRDHVDMLFCQRLRSQSDRSFVGALFDSVFQDTALASDLFSSISPLTLQVGNAIMTRNDVTTTSTTKEWIPRCTNDLRILQYIMVAVGHKWPVILAGKAGVGKTALIERLAHAVGVSLQIFSLNADTDATDLVGGYEQADPYSRAQQTAERTRDAAELRFKNSLVRASESHNVDMLDGISEEIMPTNKTSFAGAPNGSRTVESADKGHFEWVDGLLVDALQQGKWLILDNANLASPSVLDRLNALLEPNGVLIINEHSETDGSPRVIAPHPDFRIIITLDPQYGELSRAMRNRAVELYIDAENFDQQDSLQIDPLWTDSGMGRFRQAQVLSKVHTVSGTEINTIFFDHLALSDHGLLDRFKRQCEKGLYSFPESLDALTEAGKSLNNRKFLADFYANALTYAKLPVSAIQVQTIHPLNNQALVCSVPEPPFAKEFIAFLHDTEMLLSTMSRALKLMQSDSSLLVKLRRDERAIHCSIDPRGSTIINTLHKIFDVMVYAFGRCKDSSNSTLPALKGFFGHGCALWHVLWTIAQGTNLQSASLRTIVLIGKDFEQFPNLEDYLYITELIPAIIEYLSALDASSTDKRGSACAAMWKSLKPAVPRTMDQLQGLTQLEAMADRFDTICQQFTLPIEIMMSLRQGFQNALDLARSGLHNASQLSASLNAILSTHETFSPPCELYFAQTFALLGEQISWAALDLASPEDAEMQALAIFMSLPTKDSVLFKKQNRTPSEHYRLLGAAIWRVRNQSIPIDGTSLNVTQTVLTQLRSIDSVRLANLNVLKLELAQISRTFANHAQIVCGDQLPGLRLFLYRLLTDILDAISPHDSGSSLRSLGKNLLASLGDASISGAQIKDRSHTNLPIADPEHPPIPVMSTVARALHTPSQSRREQLSEAAKTWTSFALACFNLYITRVPFDPALEPQIRLQMHDWRRSRLISQRDALRIWRSTLYGQPKTFRVSTIDADLEAIGPRPQYEEILRPNTPQLDMLYADLNGLMRTLEHIKDPSAALEPTILENTLNLRKKLAKDYKVYQDLVSPIVGFIDCLLMGHRLAIEAVANYREEKSSLDDVLPFVNGSMATWLSDDVFCKAAEQAQSRAAQFCWLGAVSCRVTMITMAQTSGQLRAALDRQFLCFYQQWRIELSADQRAETAKSSLYRFRGDQTESEITDRELQELFPMIIHDRLNTCANSNIQDTASDIARLHQSIFVPHEVSEENLEDLLTHWSLDVSDGFQKIAEVRALPTTILALQHLNLKLASHKPQARADIHTESNYAEVTKLVALIHSVKTRFSTLQAAWPDHATPVEVLRLCAQLEDISYSAPPMRFLPLLETLHSTANQWQKIASIEYSVGTIIDDIVGLIIHWRQLELSSWTGLFDREWQKCESTAASWWFVAYETIIAASRSVSSSEDMFVHARGLLGTLSQFLSSSGLGEFSARMKMLRAFEAHLTAVEDQDVSLQSVRFGLSNLNVYFGAFEAPVQDVINKGRTALEKDIEEVIKLASWKDRNIDTLRQSANASHQKLLRIVRKYRSLLAQSVSQIISGGYPEAPSIVDREFALPQAERVSHTTVVQTSETVPAWELRHDRFRNVDRTASMITSKAEPTFTALSAPIRINAFVQETLDYVAKLRKETPSLLTKENRSLVNHLKTRKRRLLADVLKNLRKMGLRDSISQQVLEQQASLEIVLARVLPLRRIHGIKKTANAEHVSNSFISLMPHVRESSRSHPEHITSVQMQRCLMLQESMLQQICQQRSLLSIMLDEHARFHTAYDQFRNFARCTSPRQTSRDEHKSPMLLKFLESVLNLTLRLLNIQAAMGDRDYSSTTNILQAKILELTEIRQETEKLPEYPPGICSRAQAANDERYLTFVASLNAFVDQAASKHPELAAVLSHIPKWTQSQADNAIINTQQRNLEAEDWLSMLFDLLDKILGSVQDLEAVSHNFNSDDLENNWLLRQQVFLARSSRVLHIPIVVQRMVRLLLELQRIQDDTTIEVLSSFSHAQLPIIDSYKNVIEKLIDQGCDLLAESSTMAYKFAEIFLSLAKNGFCTPDEKSKENAAGKDLEVGTGLGDGQGVEDISKDIEDNEDLSELAQQPKDRDDQDDKLADADNAIDMGIEDLEGEFGDDIASDQGDQEDLSDDEDQNMGVDEERGDVNDLDPSAVDEKMWNSGREDEEKDKKANADDKHVNEENVAPVDNEAQKENRNNQEEDSIMAEKPDDENDRVDHQLDEQPQADLNDQDALEIPDTIDISRDDTDNESQIGSLTDEVRDSLSIKDESIHEDESIDHGDETMETQSQTHDNENGQGSEDAEEMNNVDGGPEEEADANHQSDTLMRDNDEFAFESCNEADTGKADGQEKAGPSGHESEVPNSLDEETENGENNGRDQSAMSHGQNDDSEVKAAQQSDASKSEQAILPFKKLGDVLEEWYKQHRPIEDSRQPEVAAENSKDMANVRFEHLPDQDATADAQALGTAPIEDSMALKEDNALPVNDEDDTFPESEQVRFDEHEARVEPEEPHTDATDIERLDLVPSAIVGQALAQDIEMTDDDGTINGRPDIYEDVDEQLNNTHLTNDRREAHDITVEEARVSWSKHEDNTRNLSLILTEHLRLILQPTQATKMRGDFRTGKRLNIKRIIPYIASSFKRDKIWMRRTVPSKRAYQVMLAIDDSKSMSENGSNELAFETLALVSRSMSMLEVGQLGVVAFGEDVLVAHGFDSVFSAEDGVEVFRKFSFAQTKTNIHKLIARSIDLFRDARLKATGSSSDLWQLQLIISDGVCEDHPSIRRLVRQAQEERIMIVFIVVDAAAQRSQSGRPTTQSILDLPTAEFVQDEAGETQLKMGKYLDTFPFRYYLIVREVQELPLVLAGALRQWFAEVAGMES